MKKAKLLELLSANDTLISEIGKIINYEDISDNAIYNLIDREWTRNVEDGLVYFDRNDEDNNMFEYSPWQISSLGAKGEEFFCGEADGIFYALAHPEDENWDDTEILILDMDRFKEYNEEEIIW